MKLKLNPLLTGLGAAGTLLLPALALAADEKPKLDTGDRPGCSPRRRWS